MKIFYHTSIPLGHSLPKFSFVAYTLHQLSLMKHQAVSKCLTGARVFHYPKTTKAKSLVGIGVPYYLKAHRRQHFNEAGFFMRTICSPFIISLGKLYSYYGGLVEGIERYTVFLESGYANLSQSTTLKIGVFGGGLKNYLKEASFMLTTPTQNAPAPIAMVYTFLISLPNKKVVDIKKPRFVSVSAKTEAQARTILKGLPLVFIKRTPANTQEVAA